jgi:hypothetical protein
LIYFEKEYRRDRMSHKLRDQWVVTKWVAPDSLPYWQANFPGADYPARGYRINTDWYNKPGVMPGHEDTIRLIWAIRKQGDKSTQQILNEMEQETERNEKAKENLIGDEIRDSFSAFLNEPGKRSGHVSMPYAKHEREEVLPNG